MSTPRPPPSVASTSRTKPLQQPLAKRLLFPSLPPDAPYPPLFSSDAVSSELDPVLYDLIALALRAFVSPWWSKISRYDKEFIPQINRILIHVIQVLELRLCQLDLPRLLFDDIPVILTQHYRDYRGAASKLSTSYASGGSYTLPHLFHQLQPHMAISQHGTLNQEYYRHIVDHILRVALPPEDYASEAERYIIREVVLKLVLVDILPKITQPWFIQLAILNALGSEQSQAGNYIPSGATSSSSTSTTNSSQSLLILLLSTVQKLSGASLAIVHAYKQAVSTIKSVNQLPEPGTYPLFSRPQSPRQTDSRDSSTPSSSSDPMSPSRRESQHFGEAPSHSMSSPLPAMALPLLILLSEILNTAERLAAKIITTALYLFIALCTPFLNRLMPHLLMTSLSSTFMLNLTRAAKRTLFPNGYPGPPMEEPTLDEQAVIRAKLIAMRPSGALGIQTPPLLTI
ncbi:hypothetical protein M378DRAFT_183242 [Amanita muscaria Koide BX008]|uniref:PXA domain-containing protein n=1 Tax=Amanita muscaria (strain Koide BX008) TaxID=946122 RepID=A0A0C2X8D3_AMAMK|nr:hypothetical protein M378DRAFT_183242 [Amanita muscaria Koide BX008]